MKGDKGRVWGWAGRRGACFPSLPPLPPSQVLGRLLHMSPGLYGALLEGLPEGASSRFIYRRGGTPGGKGRRIASKRLVSGPPLDAVPDSPSNPLPLVALD